MQVCMQGRQEMNDLINKIQSDLPGFSKGQKQVEYR